MSHCFVSRGLLYTLVSHTLWRVFVEQISRLSLLADIPTIVHRYIVRNYRGSVEYRATIKSQHTIFLSSRFPFIRTPLPLSTTMILGEKGKKEKTCLSMGSCIHTHTFFSLFVRDGRRMNQDFNIPPLHRLRTSYRLFPVNDVIVSAG